MRHLFKATTISLLAPVSAFAASAAPTLEDLQKQIDAQQQRIASLEQAQTPAAEPSKTFFGGYGELHYNNLDSGEELDLHRVVLFIGHRFDSRTRFNSEIEIEHAFVEGGEGGEVAVEQAFVERDWNNQWKSRFGLFLMPVGIINERHEPPTFYGVERNPVERNIVPATWSEGGIQTIGTFGGLSVDLAVSGGIQVDDQTAGKEFLIRDSRQGASEAAASSPAYTARVQWRGTPGLELSLSAMYQDDAGQGEVDNVGAATLVQAHAIYRVRALDLRALYARFELDGSAPAALNRDVQDGGYLEASYKITPELGVFTRYNVYDNGGSGDETETRQTNAGINYWLIPEVVLKADYQWQSGAGADDGFNLGVGYQF